MEEMLRSQGRGMKEGKKEGFHVALVLRLAFGFLSEMD
jgi:hypothetical protein